MSRPGHEGADPARVAALFDAVVDLPPEEASRRIEEAAGGDAALREAVARLLEHDRAAEAGFLAAPAAVAVEALREREALATTAVAAAEAPGEGPPATTKLGRFFVLHKLGEGGMGVVYVGYDEVLDRRVALKLLRRGAAARAWLLREGQALGRLASPHVVAVHEVGEHEGRVFLAMELVRGASLTAWLAARPRAWGEVIGVLVQAGRGLAAAHEAGLVHRDFKPDNVLVGDDGRARVADFGIAALAAGEAEPRAPAPREANASPSALASPLTGAGALVGTPAFMAPELFRGARATAASDQWAYCASLYRAAYGAAPFPTDDVAKLGRALAETDPAPPPPGHGAPAWLWPVIRRGLSREPADRFPSMGALLAAIERHVPRDPALDPAAVRAERRILSVVVFLMSLGIAGTVLGGGGDRLARERWALVRIALIIVTVGAAVMALLRRRLAKSLYGRRLAGVLLAVGLGMLAHRLLGVRLGTPARHVVLGDLVLLAAIYGVAALTVERALAGLAAVALAGAAVGAYEPSLAIVCFGAVSVTNTTVLLWIWGRRG